MCVWGEEMKRSDCVVLVCVRCSVRGVQKSCGVHELCARVYIYCACVCVCVWGGGGGGLDEEK